MRVLLLLLKGWDLRQSLHINPLTKASEMVNSKWPNKILGKATGYYFVWENSRTHDLRVLEARIPHRVRGSLLKTPLTDTDSRQLSIKQSRNSFMDTFLFTSSPAIIFFFFYLKIPWITWTTFYYSAENCFESLHRTRLTAKSPHHTHKVSLPPALCLQVMEEPWPLLSHARRTNRFSVLTNGKILVLVVFGLSVAPRTLAVL